MTQEETTVSQEHEPQESQTATSETTSGPRVPFLGPLLSPDAANLSDLAKEREERMRQREQELSRERDWRTKRTLGTGQLPEPVRTMDDSSQMFEQPVRKSKPVRPPKDPRLDRETPLYRDYDRDPETTWQGGMVEVEEMMQNRIVQVALGAILFCFVVIIIISIIQSSTSAPAPTAVIQQIVSGFGFQVSGFGF